MTGLNPTVGATSAGDEWFSRTIEVHSGGESSRAKGADMMLGRADKPSATAEDQL